jgi:hypothetical protein
MKNRFIVSTLLLTSCLSLPYKRVILVPGVDYRVSQNAIKTNGYYYSEKTREDFCKQIPSGSGMTGDMNSKYEQRYISTFVLFLDGYSYCTGSLITSGIDVSSFDFCDQVDANNTFERAREKFETMLTQPSRTLRSDKFDRGVFSLTQDTIRIQIYQTGSESLQLIEYQGVVLNDTTFHLHNQRHYNASRKKQNQKLDETYHFKMHRNKPDSTSYIRNHRDKFRLSTRR